MRFKIQVVIDDGQGETKTEDIIHLERSFGQNSPVGLSLIESKQLLKLLQQKMVLCQAKDFTASQKYCQCCSRKGSVAKISGID